MLTFVSGIYTLAVRYDFSITSWIRSSKRNKQVGGSQNSRHLLGLAVDIILDNPTDLRDFIKDAELLRLKVIDEKTHLHVQLPSKPRKGVKT